MNKQVLKAAAIFSDNMVLQRYKNINIWGTGENGHKVQLYFNNKVVRTIVKDNKWRAILPSMPAGGPYELKITDGEQFLKFSNVMLGEVWLAGGQSNIELELQNSKNGDEALKKVSKACNVRYYYTQKNAYIDEQFLKMEAETCWQECTKETAGNWSAVGYYFAKELAEELKVTVGIIGCNWGGTSASAWISTKKLEEDKDTNSYNEEYKKANEGRSFEKYLEQLEQYNIWYDKWQKKVNKCYEENPNILWSKVLEIAGENLWPEPLGPKSPYRAGGLYETMIKRIMPYSLKGFLYYQGESDDHKPKLYYKLLNKLIEQWREAWADDELPFLIVQLPMYIGREDKDKKNWPLIREAQMRVHKTVKNTGLAVILDCGEFDNIHPLDKETVGHRLFLQAMFHTYNKKVAAYGPVFKALEYKGNKIELIFDNCESGIKIKGDKAEGFEIAGDDKQFLVASIEIQRNKILVFAQEINNPKYVRYAWTNYGAVTLFNEAGIPMSTFRTSVNDEK